MELSQRFQLQAGVVADEYRSALESEDVVWDEARVFVEFIEDPHPAQLFGCRARANGEMTAGILATDEIKQAMKDLRQAIESDTGASLCRLRVSLTATAVTEVFHTDVASGEMRVVWSWPDEDEDGSAIPTAVVSWRVVDNVMCVPSTGDELAPEDSIARIASWLSEHAPGYVDDFNEPATEQQLDEVEAQLGLVLPRSVREAYLVHNGQPLVAANVLVNNWIALDDMGEELELLSDRGDEARAWIPIMKTDGIVLFVDGVAEVGEESAVWLWEYRSQQDERVADSFGAYLSQLADMMEREEVFVDEDSGVIYLG